MPGIDHGLRLDFLSLSETSLTAQWTTHLLSAWPSLASGASILISFLVVRVSHAPASTHCQSGLAG